MFFQQQQAIDDKKLLPKAQNKPFHSGDNSSTVEVRFEENHQTSYSNLQAENENHFGNTET